MAPAADIDPSLSVVKQLVIAGVPSAGKTTISHMLVQLSQARLRHCDELIDTGLDWSAQSLEVSTWFDEPGPWIVEGVASVRALRKWMKREPDGKPCDAVLWLGDPVVEIEGRVLGLAKGCRTIWEEIKPELVSRGVEIILPTGA